MDSELHTKKKSKHKKKKETKPSKQPEPVVHEPVQTKVQIIRENLDKSLPCIGYFPSGYDPINSSSSGSTDIQVYRNKVRTKRLELVVRPAGSSVEFVGTSYMGEAATGQRARYALGVFDKEAQTLKVVPIGANKIFRLDPKVKGLEANVETEHSTMEDLTLEQKMEKMKESALLIGTKSQIKYNNKWDEIKRDEEPEAKKNLDEKMKNVVVNETALANTEAHVSRDIPPYNSSATTPQEAYVLDSIILKGEWASLEEIYYNLQKGEAADFKGYPRFIQERIDRLKKIEDESEKLKLCCILSFVNHLVKFKDQHSMDDFSSSKSHKIPNILRNRFLTMFAVDESKRLPPEKINLLICYILVLTLFCDNFQSEFYTMSRDLKIGIGPVRTLYQHVGCRFLSKNKTVYAALSVPLKFPSLKPKRKRPGA